jgi:8-oxo-dGTP diphosphatase
VVDVVFLCRYQSGEPRIDDPGEVAELLWLPAAEVMQHPKVSTWTHSSITRAEKVREQLG